MVVCVCWALCVPVWAQAPSDDAASETVFEIDIPAGNAADALNRLAEQTGAILLFPYDLAEARQANAVVGRYTLLQALSALLKDSGLSGGLSDRRVIQIVVDEMSTTTKETSRGGEQAMNATKKAGLIAIITGALSALANAQESTVGETEIQTSVVIGKVTDARTGANLKGAKVTFEETGQWVSTNDLGEFRLSNIPMGNATLTVSYLGYAEQSDSISVRDESVTHSFSLRGGSEIEEIVVFGQRSARTIALNQERTAANSTTVLSSDVLGQFAGTTISEALRRAPGISFEVDPNTGDGANVIVRGLEPDLNQVQLNGVRLPDTSGIGRSPDLSGILTESIESVTVNKTLLPSHDSNGAGGLIEIETKSPLDRPTRYASIGVEQGGLTNEQRDDLLISGTLSGIFGSDRNWGASVSVQYRDRESINVNYALPVFDFGPYLPAGARRALDIDAFEVFPFEDGNIDLLYPDDVAANESTTRDENLSITVTAQRQVGEHTNLRFDYTRSDIAAEDFSTDIEFQPISLYREIPIDSLGGEERFVLVTGDVVAALPGVNFRSNRGATYVPERKSATDTFSFRGETISNRWSFDYGVGLSTGNSESSDSFSLAVASPITRDFDQTLLADDILTNLTDDGRIVSIFRPLAPNDEAFPLPGFTADGFAFFSDPSLTELQELRVLGGVDGSNERLTFNGSARRDLDGANLRYVEFGLFYEDADFDSIPSAGILLNREAPSGTDLFLSDIGIGFETGLLTTVGATSDVGALSESDVLSFIRQSDALVSNGSLVEEVVSAPLSADQRLINSEDELSGYFESRVDFGRLEVIGGLRVSRVAVETDFLSEVSIVDEFGIPVDTTADRFTQVLSGTATQTDFLPRVLANFRWSDNVVVRLGYFSTVARPRVQNLVSSAFILLDLREQYGPSGNQPILRLSRGNPELEPAETDNFDVSIEYFDSAAGAVKLAAFYKTTKNPLERAFETLEGNAVQDFELPNLPELQNLPGNIFLLSSQVVNSNKSADIWGFEVSAERQFVGFPSWASGFGAYVNYTYTDSSRDITTSRFDAAAGEVVEVVLRDVAFDGSPKHSGTAAITYSKYGIDASLAYSIQDRRLSRFAANGLSDYEEEISTLDFRAEYWTDMFGANMRFFVEGNDILRSENEAFIQSSIGGQGSAAKYFNGGRFFGGRSINIGVTSTFQ